MADKPYRAPKQRGPQPVLIDFNIASVKLGERERAMIRLYARRHFGIEDDSKVNTSAVLRWGLEILGTDFAPEEIEAEIERLKEQE